MSRSGLSEDDGDDPLAFGRWRGAVKSAISGKRGQAFLQELAAALDAMPEKVLVAGELQDEDGCLCTLGVIGKARGLALESMDVDDYDSIAGSLNVNAKIAQEIMWENDETFSDWTYVRVEICGPMRGDFHDRCGWHRESHKRDVRVMKENAGHLRWKHMRAWVASQLKGVAA
jgi:hypothetical protein